MQFKEPPSCLDSAYERGALVSGFQFEPVFKENKMSNSYSYEETNMAREAAKEALQIQGQRVRSYAQKKEEEYLEKLMAAQSTSNIPPGFNGQPSPKPNNNKPTWHLVIEDMLARDNVGRKKYNTPLHPHNGRDSLQDAYEEALDLCVYLKNAIEERNAGKA